MRNSKDLGAQNSRFVRTYPLSISEEILFVSFFFGGNLLCQEAKIITSKFSIMSSSMANLDVSKKTISLIRIRREIPGGSIIMSLPVQGPSFK